MHVFALLCSQPLQYQYRGAESALTAVANHFGPRLFTALPQLWSHVSQPLENLPVPREEDRGRCVCACVLGIVYIQCIELSSMINHTSIQCTPYTEL